MEINFVFVRHGQGCHNARQTLSELFNPKLNELRSQKKLDKDSFNLNFVDPELTDAGVQISKYNGCIVSKTIREIGKKILKDDRFETFNIIGTSPLLRSMETAYYMTEEWPIKPNKIYVFPHLREINEMSLNFDDQTYIYNERSKNLMDIIPVYMMKSINEQKEYLKKTNIPDLYDFSYVEKDEKGRKDAGDIEKFIHWFVNKFVDDFKPQKRLNVFIVTHAGVLKHFMKYSMNKEIDFFNNSGFILSVNASNKKKIELEKYISLNDYLPKKFFTKYSSINKEKYFCPSNRCGNICSVVKYNKSNSISKVNLPECKLYKE
jgi:broad specificity phosphatase PhoE